jgi:hypothetical protein
MEIGLRRSVLYCKAQVSDFCRDKSQDTGTDTSRLSTVSRPLDCQWRARAASFQPHKQILVFVDEERHQLLSWLLLPTMRKPAKQTTNLDMPGPSPQLSISFHSHRLGPRRRDAELARCLVAGLRTSDSLSERTVSSSL